VAVTEGRTGHVAWTAAGDGPGVPVLLLHGITDSAECWSPVVAHLAAGRRVVAADARGHGRSALPDGSATIADLAADAAAVLADAIGAPAVVVGHSMGGVTAQELVHVVPDQVAALVLEDPAWGPHDVDARGVPVGLAGWTDTFAGRTAEQMEEWAREHERAWPDDEYAPWARAKVAFAPDFPRREQRWDGREWVADAAGLVRAGVPVTVVAGDPVLGSAVPAGAQARASRIDGLTFVPVTGVGHNVRREARETFLAALDAALARADAARSA